MHSVVQLLERPQLKVKWLFLEVFEPKMLQFFDFFVFVGVFFLISLELLFFKADKGLFVRFSYFLWPFYELYFLVKKTITKNDTNLCLLSKYLYFLSFFSFSRISRL